MPLGGDFFTCSISYCKVNIKCDSASNAPKYPLNNGVSIVKNLVVKLSNTSTMFFPLVMVYMFFTGLTPLYVLFRAKPIFAFHYIACV